MGARETMKTPDAQLREDLRTWLEANRPTDLGDEIPIVEAGNAEEYPDTCVVVWTSDDVEHHEGMDYTATVGGMVSFRSSIDDYKPAPERHKKATGGLWEKLGTIASRGGPLANTYLHTNGRPGKALALQAPSINPEERYLISDIPFEAVCTVAS